jgi:hypothetical protein
VDGSQNGCAEGCRVGATFGTSWHGVFESDGFRRAFLRRVAGVHGLDWTPGSELFAARREAQLEKLGDLIAEHVNRDALLRLIFDSCQRGSCQQSVISCQLVRRAPKLPRAGAPVDEANAPGESTAATAQARRSAVEAKLKAES